MIYAGQWVNCEARRIQRETHHQVSWVYDSTVAYDGMIGSIEWTAQHCDTSYDCHGPYSWVRTALGPLFRRPLGVTTIEMLNRVRKDRVLSDTYPSWFFDKEVFVKPAHDLKRWTGKVMDDNDVYLTLLDHEAAVIEVQPVVEIRDEHRTFWVFQEKGWVCTGGAAYPVEEEVDAWFYGDLQDHCEEFETILYLIKQALDNRIPEACPDGLCIDIGRIDGRLGVVEHCAAFGCGTYGATQAYLEANTAWYRSIRGAR